MLRATEIVTAGAWKGAPADVVRLDYDKRTRRRVAVAGVGGLEFLLDLAKTPVLRAGDVINLDVNPNLLPPEDPEVTTHLRPVLRFCYADFWAQGMNFGIEGKW